MRTLEINLYTFDELDPILQGYITDKYRNINAIHQWWQPVYEDAETIDFKIESFIPDHRFIDGGFIEFAEITANKIIANHGIHCGTYKAAQQFRDFRDVEQFRDALFEEYYKMLEDLQTELTSDEAIRETILNNNWEFTKDGERYI